MAYIADQKSTGLDTLTDATITQSDLHIVGDVSDSGRAKAITQNYLEDYIANSTNFITELTTNTDFITNLTTIITSVGGSADTVTRSITQASHGFAVGDVIRSSGSAGAFAKAQADTAANAETIGIVTTVTDANTFIVTTEGFITAGVPTATAGTAYYLSSSSAGALTATEPSSYSKKLLIVLTSSSLAYYHNNTTILKGSANFKNGTTSYNSTTASGTQTIAHGMGVTPSRCSIHVSGYESSGVYGCSGYAVYNGTTLSTLSDCPNVSGGGATGVGTVLYVYSGANTGQSATAITLDATNINIAWTKEGSPTGNIDIVWEAEI